MGCAYLKFGFITPLNLSEGFWPYVIYFYLDGLSSVVTASVLVDVCCKQSAPR
jgi:hypothetical protein